MKPRELDERAIYIEEPESLTIRQLNGAVRALREAVHEEKIRALASEERARRVDGEVADWKRRFEETEQDWKRVLAEREEARERARRAEQALGDCLRRLECVMWPTSGDRFAMEQARIALDPPPAATETRPTPTNEAADE